MADLTQLTRLAWLFGRISPGLDVKPLLAEIKERVLEELDYTLEADAQRAFAAAFADDPDIAVPRVVASAPKVDRHRVDGRHAAVVDHRLRHPGRARPRRLAAGAAALLAPRRGPGCCTPTRTRATSGCCPTAGSASSTSARWPGCPAATRRRSAG